MHRGSWPRYRLPLPATLIALLSSLVFFFSSPFSLFADPTTDPTGVAIASDFQSELGCPGDWQPECANTELTYDAADDVWQGTFTIPAGNWQYKAALNDSWDESYGPPGGGNVILNLTAETTVKFYYDHKSHWVTDNQTAVIAVAPGDFQSELGCPGDWQADCLRSWLQDADGDGIYEFLTTGLGAGNYAAKVAINESWDENYGVGGTPGGGDIPFTVAADNDEMRFRYDAVSHILTVEPVTPPPPADLDYAIIRYQRTDGDYGDWTSSDFNDFWGLHLWGEAIDPSEATEWAAPKKFSGIDDYGAYVAIRLQDANKPVNFIIHRGNTKDTEPDRNFVPAQIPVNWLVQGNVDNHASRAAALGQTVIHYQRADGNYDGWGLHLWGEGLADGEATEWNTPKLPDGEDSYGKYFVVKLADPTKPVNFIVHKGDEKDTDPDRSYVPAQQYAIWLKSGQETIYTQQIAAENKAIIHYRRAQGDYDGWGLHLWTGSAEQGITWENPLMPTGTDAFGVYWEVDLVENATMLNYIIHKGDEKDPGPDQALIFADKGYEIWQLQGSGEQYSDAAIAWAVANQGSASGNIGEQKAYWVSQDQIVWPSADDKNAVYRLHYSGDASLDLAEAGITGGSVLTLTHTADSITGTVAAQFPHLVNQPVLTLGSEGHREQVMMILKGQFAVSMHNGEGALVDATGLQIPGVVDDLFTYEGPLGMTWNGDVPSFHLWAPTARSVTLHIFDDANPATTSVTYTLPFNTQTGVWSETGIADWKNKFYLYEVEVFVPSTGAIERNIVTDPYSLSLAQNSTRSQIVDLRDAALKPAGWDAHLRPHTGLAPEDITVYELHVRDFSALDTTVPENLRGTYKAFTLPNSAGINHLKALRAAGLTHVHLLPAFDLATIDEDKSTWKFPDYTALAAMEPYSETQQSEVMAVAAEDPFNWGYDPFHYTTPEGSYSTNPDGTTRIVEFREMVKALQEMGFYVVMDVVYNHTNASGQAAKSVLDKVVPGYYHRLNNRGQVETSTCCPNTASEHAMMEKLMVDSLVVWARDYKVDAFRFDLMGHHMVDDLLAVRAALDSLTVANDGIDGKSIYLYGEGWNFGEVVDNTRGVNATQRNLAGTGIGTFSDRLRDAVRGGSPFDSGQDLLNQGWANGLFYDANAKDQGSADDQKARLLHLSDLVRLGLAGNLRDFTLINAAGQTVMGKDVDYNGQPAGYTLDPQEHVVYASKHDNQTLYDNNAYKLPVGTSMADRIRTQAVGLSTVLLSQGVPFLHAGSDILRSKSLDRDSYDSGDWFNILDWSYTESGWGRGLPPAGKNQENWDVMRPLLSNPALKPAKADIERTHALVREFLQIRYSSPLFRLQTAQQVQDHLSFHNTGPDQIPGLIVMALHDKALFDFDPNHEMIVVAFNANDEAQTITLNALQGISLTLHPVQQTSVDATVKTATFNAANGTITVPGRTTAVFVERQTTQHDIILPMILKNYSFAPAPEDQALFQAPVQHAVQEDVFYFVLPDRFYNGDTANDFGIGPGGDTITDTLRHGFLPTDKGYFHGGDLKGLLQKMDYLQALGVTALWMTPIFENRAVQGDGTLAGSSAGYHGYWITKFDRVDPHLGANADLKALVDEAHKRGMKVFFDIITNHTADIIDYEEGQYGYRSKEDFPYKNAAGTVFDDRDYVGQANFPALDAATSFAYTPVFRSAADETVKVPAWLNNPIYYHNRGNSTFSGESSNYGDFIGLDDLFTEHPVVVDGMIDIYKSWITDYKIDGFRIDTVKHVNMEFWQRFGPEIMAHAEAQGVAEFYMFGEVFDSNPAFMSQYSTEGKLPSTLDFGIQSQAVGFAVNGNATHNLRDFFAQDDYYTDADSNAYGLANFVGNHDMGRIGYFIKNALPNATETEMMRRSLLAHGVIFFARGFPVIYYGDEQGFVGDGGDKDARQNMFPSQVASYNDDNLLGTDATTAADNFDQSHPIFTTLKEFAAIRKAHPTLAYGSQIHRYSVPNAGIYAFSRFDRETRMEYVVALNNATTPQRASFPVYAAGSAFTAVYPSSAPGLMSDPSGMLTVDVPPLSLVVYRAGQPARALTVESDTRAVDLWNLRFTSPEPDGEVSGRAEIAVDFGSDYYSEVTFAVKVGEGEWTVIGTDTNPPYRVFYDVRSLPISATVTFKAVANDFVNKLQSTTVSATVVEEEIPGGGAGYAVIHYHRTDGNYDGWGLHLWGDAIADDEATEWATPKLPNGEDRYGKFFWIKLKDAAKPVNFIIHKGDEKDTDPDRSFIPEQQRQIWLKQGDEAIHANAAAALGEVVIHYKRTAGDYEGWGLHLWGEGLAQGEATEWATPKLPDGEDSYGKYFVVKLADPTKPVNFIVHKGDEKDTDPDRAFTPTEMREIWLAQGDETIHAHPGAVENYAVIHYHRPAGDYTGWGLHVWGDADEPAVTWQNPLPPINQDAFGQVYRVKLKENAAFVGYILHKGDEKDLPADQQLDLAKNGHEVWIVQSTEGYLLSR